MSPNLLNPDMIRLAESYEESIESHNISSPNNCNQNLIPNDRNTVHAIMRNLCHWYYN